MYISFVSRGRAVRRCLKGDALMKRSDFFYIWVAIVSYLIGPLIYLLTLRFIYGETTRDMGRFIIWTAPAFFTVGIFLYLICVIILRSINKYYFWLQTLAFVLVGTIPVYIVPLIAGFFKTENLSFLFSQEGILFFLFFSSIAVVSSYGTWIAQKRQNKRPFIILSILILVFLIVV